MRLTVAGCGDAFGSGTRHQSCYLLDYSGGRIMIDCGASAPLGLKKLGIPLSSIDAIAISHLHGDHFGGLPFLLIDGMYESRLNKTLPVLLPRTGAERTMAFIDSIYAGIRQQPSGFAFAYDEIEAGQSKTFQGLTIETFEMLHESGAPSLGYRINADGKIFAFSGDTGWCENVIHVGRNAGLYLIECSTYKTKLGMHLDYETIARNMDAIGANHYLLTHMSEEMLVQKDKIGPLKFHFAHDGLIIDI
jgi:ribonuclease BN (tRNA processing enzyme)